MRVLVSSFGSRGDIHPFIALGLELAARGHSVVFALERPFIPLAADLGFPTVTLTGDPSMLAPHADLLREGSNALASLTLAWRIYIEPTLTAKLEELDAPCRRADVVVSPPVHVAAALAADRRRVPWVSVSLSPAIPSAELDPQEYPFPMPEVLRRLLNRLAWALGDVFLRRVADPAVNRLRHAHGLGPIRGALRVDAARAAAAALAVSPALLTPPPDWPPTLAVTGFCFWDAPDGQDVPPELGEFLAEPGPVVAVTIGSFDGGSGDRVARFFQETANAASSLNVRVLLIGPADARSVDGASRVLAVPYAPFSYVFERCQAVIHHGGIGTLAQALRAGVPSLAVPWGFDQFFNAAQVKRRGLGLTVPFRSYSRERAARALERLLADNRFKTAAAAHAVAIAAENGPRTLACLVESVGHA
ncbi:MAG: glycosyltransferase [Firmicutes bacterium]|nr:glycosyltransferase [Bacillota bacterium]